MEWAEIAVHTTTQASDLVSEAMIQSGATGTMIVDKNDIPDPSLPHGYWELIDEKMIEAMPEDVLVQGWFALDFNLSDSLNTLALSLENLKTIALPFPLGSLAIVQKNVNEQDWANRWKDLTKPLKPGKIIVIKPTWEDYSPTPFEKVIEMDPGMAFGTGTHETTAMCITLLEKYITPSMTVADIGTGSGILAIASALLGASNVTAVDIDPSAVQVAKENIKMNGLERHIEVLQGDLLEVTNKKFDLCVANIIADVICFLAPHLHKNLTDNGLFICSGIIDKQAEQVITALSKNGYMLIEQTADGEWIALVWRKIPS